MKHINKCEKCGKEYNPEIKMDTEETPKCDFCGALLFRYSSPTTGETDDDQHLVEKGLRKAADKLTGHKG
jgi:NAD-dependent SIR2 family protein deacetylase